MSVFSLETKLVLSEGGDEFDYFLFEEKETALSMLSSIIETYYGNDDNFLDEEIVRIDFDKSLGSAVVVYENGDEKFFTVVEKTIL